MTECIECGAPVRPSDTVCESCMATEAELLAMLKEPTVDRVRRDQIKADTLMRDVGRALAPVVNSMLADLAERIESKENDRA